ncbi:MAG: peroxiredoxin-like family protein [Kiritimatiellia bacterium]
MNHLTTIALLALLPLHLFGGETEVIETGKPLPDVEVRKADGTTVTLHDLHQDTPTVLVFYRGGWCPYCTRHLSALGEVEGRLREAGYQIIAVSPDRPEKVKESLEKHEFSYQLVSDSPMNAAKAFGLAFTVDEETFKQLQGYGIDIEGDSGTTHRMLPVPAVFLIDAEGIIQFVHADPDYKQRLSNAALLKAAGM